MLRCRVFSVPWFASLFAVALLTAGGLPQPAHADEFGEGAKKFVEVLADDAIRSLAVNDISKDERATRFRQLMLKNFAIKAFQSDVLTHFAYIDSSRRRKNQEESSRPPRGNLDHYRLFPSG